MLLGLDLHLKCNNLFKLSLLCVIFEDIYNFDWFLLPGYLDRTLFQGGKIIIKSLIDPTGRYLFLVHSFCSIEVANCWDDCTY